MRACVTKRDILYVLGDVTWSHKGLQKIKDAEFPCKMIMVGGNHDTLKATDYLQIFDELHGAIRYKGYWFTHIPVHPMELRGKLNVHGHCHRGGPYEGDDEDTRYFNAILEYNDYMPINMQKVGTIIQDRYDNKRLKESDNEGKACTSGDDS